MKKIGIGIDYSNICKEYNTVYLDRDNNDPETTKCMRQVLSWMKSFLSELLEHCESDIYNLNSDTPVQVADIASKRFLFYSLEKEITLQSYVIDTKYIEYESLAFWESDSQNNILIQNDADGGGVYFYCDEGSDVEQWIKEKLKNFSLDEVPFEAK